MIIPGTKDTICALSTAPGMGAIAVVRVSGPETFSIVDRLFSKALDKVLSHTVHYGTIKDGDHLIDEVVATIFRGPNSFTGEDVIEISCHGSVWIQQQLVQLLIRSGCRMAEPGEFTMRAFFNRKMDLSQAEAVADLISAGNEAAHKLAMHQMRGGFSKEINRLRQELIDFASLIELELDFAEEDVEFADRSNLEALVARIRKVLHDLISSFALGNVLKNGIPVAIVGVPNVGKSTLLNALLNEDRAIVSEIAGTTRDTIEDEVNLGGVSFRFIDTAGLRKTEDTIESIGIGRSYEKAREASLILYLVDAANADRKSVEDVVKDFRAQLEGDHQKLLLLFNKIDQYKGSVSALQQEFSDLGTVIPLSAKEGTGLDTLRESLLQTVNTGELQSRDLIVTNARHYSALTKADEALHRVGEGLTSGIPSDLLAMDIRQGLHHLGEITGEITTDDLLGNIFSKFCIGK